MKKIAIQGHVTRGKDIIKILKNLGGENMFNCKGHNVALFYYINSSGFITCNFSKGMPEGYEYYTLEDYEQKFTNMETKRNIQIDLITAREWYKQGGDLRKVALQAFTESELNSLPKSWEEYCEINPFLDPNKETVLDMCGQTHILFSTIFKRKDYPGAIPSKERAEQFLILNKLLQIRDYYNQGWEPDWNDSSERKYVIVTNRNGLYKSASWVISFLFSFKTKELRDKFFKNFKNQLELIKEFL